MVFLKKIIQPIVSNLFDGPCFAHSRKKFNDLEGALKIPALKLALPFVFRGAGHYRRMKLNQNQDEIQALYAEVLAMQPKVVMEIGTCQGGSLYLWCKAAHPEATIISMDLPGGAFGGGYPEACVKFYELFKRGTQKLHLLRMDSHAASSEESLKKILGENKMDFLFIDGDHTYEGVKKDYEMYSPLVRGGGLIAFHDIIPCEGVSRLWDEIKKANKNTRELVDSAGTKRPFGIGVLKK
jgi:predicted O-methyltransferase YrrM